MVVDWKDISKRTWRDGKNVQESMHRGAVVVHGNTAYVRPLGSCKVYTFENTPGEKQLSRLPDNANKNCGLAVICGLLTSVGGYDSGCTNTLLSLTGDGERWQWLEVFPPMPTPRLNVACITTEQALVVAGGFASGYLDTVEVMNVNTKQWTTASSLPQKHLQLSDAVCGDTLYLAGGYDVGYKPSKSVFTCSLSVLVTSSTLGSRIRHKLSRGHNVRVWKEVRSLPVVESTLASFGGDLLAIGGEDDSGRPTSHVYRYDTHDGSWNVVSQMTSKRSLCFAFALPGDCLVVVGGYGASKFSTALNSVEILE